MESFILVFLFYTDGLNLQVSLGHCRWICLMLPREQQNEGRRETVFRGDGRMAMFILDFRIGCINRGATHSFDPLLVSPCWPAVRQPLPHMMIPSDSLTVTARFDGISSTSRKMFRGELSSARCARASLLLNRRCPRSRP